MENEDYQKALHIVFTELKKDEDLFYAWKSNIAFSFIDKLSWAGYRFPDMNKLANEAAESFLNVMIKKINAYIGEHFTK